MNKKDMRIIKLLNRGLTIDQITDKIGHKDNQRVIDAIKREAKEKWLKAVKEHEKSFWGRMCDRFSIEGIPVKESFDKIRKARKDNK